MSRHLVPLLLVVAALAMAGCATTTTPTATQTPTDTPTATDTPTPTATPTETTTSEPTRVPSGDDVPVVLSNGGEENHTVRVSVVNGSTVHFNETVMIAPGAERTITTLRGPDATYRIRATMDGEAIDENVTLYPGFLESQIRITDSGGLEYTDLVN